MGNVESMRIEEMARGIPAHDRLDMKRIVHTKPRNFGLAENQFDHEILE